LAWRFLVRQKGADVSAAILRVDGDTGTLTGTWRDGKLTNPTRLRAFVKEYGIDYTVLLAGEPAQLAEKVPQVSNLNAFPTTLFVGRDGKVKSTHAGFPGPASGSYYQQARKDITALVERLLAFTALCRSAAGRSRGS
jgi:hypothetical protein